MHRCAGHRVRRWTAHPGGRRVTHSVGVGLKASGGAVRPSVWGSPHVLALCVVSRRVLPSEHSIAFCMKLRRWKRPQVFTDQKGQIPIWQVLGILGPEVTYEASSRATLSLKTCSY